MTNGNEKQINRFHLAKILSSVFLMFVFAFLLSGKAFALQYKIGSTTYSTLADAIDGASRGDTIKVTEGGTDSSNAVVSTSVYLDTNGLTITKARYPITVNSGKTLEIKGTGTIQTRAPTADVNSSSNNKLDLLIANHGTFRLREATLINKGYNYDEPNYVSDEGSCYWYVIKNYDGSSFKMFSGIIRTDTPAGLGGMETARCIGVRNGADLTITGGRLEMNNHASVGIAFARCSTTNEISNLTISATNSPWSEGIRIQYSTSSKSTITLSNVNINLPDSNSDGIAMYRESYTEIIFKSGSINVGGIGIWLDGSSSTINHKILQIGEQGGGVSQTNPSIKGGTYGLADFTDVNLKFYDGIIEGLTAARRDTSYTTIETDRIVKSGTDGSYKTEYLGFPDAINPTLTAYSGTYDGSSHTITVSGGSYGTIQYSTDNSTWSTTKPTRTNAGTTTVYVRVLGDSTHETTSSINTTIKINAKSISVTGDNKSKTYGNANPTFTATVGSTGISGQTGKITGSPTCSATATSNVGTYNITKGTVALTDNGNFKASNYSLSWSNGTLTVNKKSITVTGDNKSKTYGAANPTFTATVGSTGISGQTGKITGSPTCSATATSNAGTYNITQGTVALTDNGNFKASNYSLSWSNGTLTINKKSITVTGDNKSKIYGTANPTFTATVGSTGISGQTGKITGTPSCSATATSNVGTYNITQGTVALTDNGDFKAANYSLSWTNGTLTISKANGYVNLSATSGTARYGTASKTFTVSSHHGGTLSVSDNHGTATCSVSGTTVTISNLSGISCGANESVCPTITITVTSGATTNYKQASATYTLKIIDDVAPTGSISVNNTSTMKNGKKAVKTRNITLAITYSDAGSSVDKMAVFEQTNNVNSLLENVSTSKAFTLSTGDGEKTVYLVLRDTWGNMTAIPTN